VKVYSFTTHPDKGWSAVTPLGIVIAEPGMQVTIAVSESWEQGADAIRIMREQPEAEPTK
jgi:hypothetical protein